MRILADENISEQVVIRLRASDCDARWVKETFWGKGDSSLLELATREGRTLITYDKDFGDLVNRDGISAPHGVILFRIHSHVPDSVKAKFAASSVMAWDSLLPGIRTIQIRHQ